MARGSYRYKLKKECNSLLSGIKLGSFQTKQKRKQIMHLLISNLVNNNIYISSLLNINEKHWYIIINDWKSKGLKESTLCAYMSAIRFVLSSKTKTNIPSNKELRLIPKGNYNSIKPYKKDILTKIYHPISKTVLEFQIYFGLSKNESILLAPSISCLKDHIFIDRAIAHNNSDRVIPIVTDEQHHAIKNRKSLLNGRFNLIDVMPLRNISELYHNELLYSGISSKENLRYLYITIVNNKNIANLCSQMGIKSKYKMQEILNAQQ